MTLTAEQLQARIGKITSSVAAGALGLHPRMTPIDAWMKITGQDSFAGNKATERGNKLEDIILDYPAEALGLVRAPAEFRGHPVHEWAGDSADALYLRDGVPVMVGEGKSAALGAAGGYGDEGSDEVPESTLVQSHWHLIHWPEVDRCVVPVLVGGYEFEFRNYFVGRDEEFEGIILEDLAQFHRDYVVTLKPPPVQAGDTGWLKRRYPRGSSGLMMADTPELAELVRRKVEASERVKAATAEEELAKNRIRAILGAHEGVQASWGSISYRNNRDSDVTDWRAVCEAAGVPQSIIDQHTTTRPGSRVLRITLKKQAARSAA